jgi:UDP-N-acetylglucosamine/UDP-N-acetylgalactosamine diphosphorylase
MKERPPPPPAQWHEGMPTQSGADALKQGKIALILLAGGSGSRLGWEKPKGTFPITPARGRTLFQLFSDKVDAASKLYELPIPVAVMTSAKNHADTVAALQRNDWDFCQQNERPFLDKDKKTSLPHTGPDGNGSVFEVMASHGVLNRWKKMGVSVISVVVVENPLNDPVDLQGISFHIDSENDITVKVVQRASLQEKVGVFVETDEGLRIFEYTEFEEGKEFTYANTSLYFFSIDFALEAGIKTCHLSHHLQWKKVQEELWGWKQERLIFDHFCFAKKISALLYPREEIFAPLKSLDDFEGVKKALTKKERRILEKITQVALPSTVIEIDPAFYYPTPSLLKKWRGRQVGPVSYVDADQENI